MVNHQPIGRLKLPQSQSTYLFQYSGGTSHGSCDHDEQIHETSNYEPENRSRPKSSHEIRSIPFLSVLFVEPSKRSKDDIHLASSPVTPKRPTTFSRSLSLQMPPRDISSTSTANLTKRIPLSPKLDLTSPYASPSSVLPRRSRGLDFSRACTSLHHSTVAEQPSPDSSPTTSGRAVMIPNRKNVGNPMNSANLADSPGTATNSLWSQMMITENSVVSSSVGNVSMMDYDSGGSSSDIDDAMDHIKDDDTLYIAPQTGRLSNAMTTPFGSAITPDPGDDGLGGFSPVTANVTSFRRARLKRGRSRNGSSSVNGLNPMHSSGPGSPPLLKSIESSLSEGCFSQDASKSIVSRWQSLGLTVDDVQDGHGVSMLRNSPGDSLGIATLEAPTMGERSKVIRRTVTRRTNMLPQSKGFARIKAALQEEGAPVDTEVRREAEVIRQVRDSDVDNTLCHQFSQPTTTASSPNILAATSNQADTPEYSSEELMNNSDVSASRRSSSSTFTSQANRNSGGLSFWNAFDERMRTPPPLTIPRGSSSGISDDINMDTTRSSMQSSTPQPPQNPSKTHHNPGFPSSMFQSSSILIDTGRKLNKRMREDDFDPNYFKRRAVSPGMSLQNSPILPQSPSQRDIGLWGPQSKSNREIPGVQVLGERVSSGGSTSSGNVSVGPAKRFGLQGMNDTSDGLMNMSIE